jgi:hypothetical protein
MECRNCDNTMEWTWACYMRSSFRTINCSSCGTPHKLRRKTRYWALQLILLVFVGVQFYLYKLIAIYIYNNHSHVFYSAHFKIVYPALCGLVVFMVWMVFDKYLLAKTGYLQAKRIR